MYARANTERALNRETEVLQIYIYEIRLFVGRCKLWQPF
jgi:hypothetical protein